MQFFPSNKSEIHSILLVSYMFPTKAHAGGLRILDLYALIREKCPHVILDMLTISRPSTDWTVEEAYGIFDHIYLSSTEKLTPDSLPVFFDGQGLIYDVIDIQFHQAAYHIDAFRKIGRKLIFTPMESQVKLFFLFVKTFMNSMSRKTFRRTKKQIRNAIQEIKFARQIDETVCVSSADADSLKKFCAKGHVTSLDTGLSRFEFSEALHPDYCVSTVKEKALSIIYVAYFGSQTNVDALDWYIEKVHPVVRSKVPDYTLKVVGRGDLVSFGKYRKEGVEFIGEVPVIAPCISEARVGIAPALSGSGFRGKINQYAILGVPCIASPLSLQGLIYKHMESVYIGETPDQFAEGCIRLLTDDNFNEAMAISARTACIEHYTWDAKWSRIREIYELSDVDLTYSL